MASEPSHEGEPFSLAQLQFVAHFPALMRLNRFLASAGLGSRRSVEELILSGQVTVNGQPVTVLSTQVQPSDHVKVGRKLVHTERPLTAIIYKPRGYVCTASDELERKTIFDLLPREWPRVFHVGRLDKESAGLLLVTNDGDLANALTHPRYKVEKEYEVTLNRPFEPQLLGKLLTGLHVEGGRAKAERVTIEGPKELRIVLTQGINRQIHKMMWAVGEYDVKELVRVRIGTIRAQGMPPGSYRLLNQKEIEALTVVSPAAKAAKPKPAAASAKPERPARPTGRAGRDARPGERPRPKGKSGRPEGRPRPTGKPARPEARLRPGKPTRPEARPRPTGKPARLEARPRPTGKPARPEARPRPTGKPTRPEARPRPGGPRGPRRGKPWQEEG